MVRVGQGSGQTRWFQSRFDFPNDGVSREEQAQPGGMLDLVRGLSNLRTRYPAFANGEIGAIASDSAEWIVFERVAASDRYLVLINRTTTGQDYRFHTAWFPQYRGARSDLLERWPRPKVEGRHRRWPADWRLGFRAGCRPGGDPPEAVRAGFRFRLRRLPRTAVAGGWLGGRLWQRRLPPKGEATG